MLQHVKLIRVRSKEASGVCGEGGECMRALLSYSFMLLVLSVVFIYFTSLHGAVVSLPGYEFALAGLKPVSSTCCAAHSAVLSLFRVRR